MLGIEWLVMSLVNMGQPVLLIVDPYLLSGVPARWASKTSFEIAVSLMVARGVPLQALPLERAAAQETLDLVLRERCVGGQIRREPLPMARLGVIAPMGTAGDPDGALPHSETFRAPEACHERLLMGMPHMPG